MRLHFISSLLIFISSYFPLALIFIIKDLDEATYLPKHLCISSVIFIVASLSYVVVLLAVKNINSGLPVKITKVTNKSGDMFTYTIPYMISFYNFNLGDWKTLLSISVFMTLMFSLAYRTQNVFINPVLALAGYGLYDCQFKDGSREKSGLLISKHPFQLGDTCVIEQLSQFLYFVSSVQLKGNSDVQ